MKKVGITGCIGSGKTYISSILEKLGFSVFDADFHAKQCMRKNSVIYQIKNIFGEEVYMEGVLQRTDLIQQLQSQLGQATETIKQMQGDLQTREREVYHAKMKAEIEKTKSNLKGTENRAKMSGTLFEKRLDDALGQVKKEVSEASKPDSPSSSPKKKQSKE